MNEHHKSTVSTAKVIYILLIVSTIIGITGVIALIMAYVFKDSSEDWLQSHYRFQIRTFWIGLLYVSLGVLTFSIFIGQLILLFTFIWMIVRCAKGLKNLEQDQAIVNEKSWLFA